MMGLTNKPSTNKTAVNGQQVFSFAPDSVSAEEVDAWFKEEISSWFISNLKKITAAVSQAEDDIEEMSASGLEDTFIERSIRDIKAACFDAIHQVLFDMM